MSIQICVLHLVQQTIKNIKMKNTTDLRNELLKAFKDLQARKIDTTAAKSMVALSNSILKSASVEADYNKFLGNKKAIKFLETPAK